MSNLKDESQSAQESKTPSTKKRDKEKEPALSKEEAGKPKEQDQPLVVEAEKGKTESRTIPAGSRREEGVVGRRGILERIRGLSPEARYRIGNIGLILFQAWVFFVANFLANFSDWWGNRSPQEAMGWSAPFVFLFFICLIMYYIPVWDKEKEPPRLVVGLVFVAIVAAIPAGVEAYPKFDQADSSWWKAIKLAIGTVCQGTAGYIAWKAAGLIPTPAAKKSSNEDSEE